MKIRFKRVLGKVATALIELGLTEAAKALAKRRDRPPRDDSS